MSTTTVTREQGPDRFQITSDGKVAGFAEFVDSGSQRIFVHTEISEEFGGQGLAAILVQDALEQTRDAGLRIVPVCPYVAKFVRKSDEFTEIVDKPRPETFEIVKQSRQQ